MGLTFEAAVPFPSSVSLRRPPGRVLCGLAHGKLRWRFASDNVFRSRPAWVPVVAVNFDECLVANPDRPRLGILPPPGSMVAIRVSMAWTSDCERLGRWWPR